MADVPVRPIVSCVNTFAYDLSAYLANILSPLTGSTDFTVNNSAHFVSTISNESIVDNEAALQKLENDTSLADRSTLTPAHIADLLNFVLRSTYFQYNGSTTDRLAQLVERRTIVREVSGSSPRPDQHSGSYNN